jgi:hypothetical protein
MNLAAMEAIPKFGSGSEVRCNLQTNLETQQHADQTKFQTGLISGESNRKRIWKPSNDEGKCIRNKYTQTSHNKQVGMN